MSELTRWSAGRLAVAVRRREVSVSEVVEAHLARSAGLQEALNAYTLLDEEGALARARDLDAAGPPEGPLAGVPVGLKDLIDHAGRPTTCGSRFHRVLPERSAAVVERIEAAGGVLLGRLGLHEFAFGFSSENPWWGPVHNPWNRAASPGGSSGGSAAAVAAGLAALTVGTDTGGSVRVPSALCGVVGLKVTHGRVPISGVFPLAPSLDTVGPLARSVEDAALLYGVLAGHDPADPWSAPRPVEAPRGPADPGGLRIGVPQPWVESTPLADDVAEAFDRGLERLSGTGAEVVEVRHPVVRSPGLILPTIYGEAARVHREWFPSRSEEYGPDVASRLLEGQDVTVDDYVEAQAWRARLRHVVAGLLEEVDVLATPATSVSRKLIGEDLIEVDGETHHYRSLLSAFSSLVNHMGNPALVGPLDAEGEPAPALQVIGRRWGEARLLEIGLGLEEAGVLAVRHPPRW